MEKNKIALCFSLDATKHVLPKRKMSRLFLLFSLLHLLRLLSSSSSLTMVSHRHHHHLLLSLFSTLLTLTFAVQSPSMYPYACSEKILTCDASLYHISTGYSKESIASFYSVNTSQLTPISHKGRQDFLIKVPCSCQSISGTLAYFYNANYSVKHGDVFVNVSTQIYSGQVWTAEGVEIPFIAGKTTVMNLLCGCVSSAIEIVTYTTQIKDSLSDIADLFSAKVSEIQIMNPLLLSNPQFIDVGWVLYVPKGIIGLSIPITADSSSNKKKIVIGIVSGAIILSMFALIVILLVRRRRRDFHSEEDPKDVLRSFNSNKTSSMRTQQLYTDNMEGVAGLDSDRPVIYALEMIEESTNFFDETKKIGEGGYGVVYYGVLGGKEVAIKQMRANKSKEFFAELKVLCKIHHINVVELLGYACGDEHLYLVYEYVHQGSLSEHLHDPLRKGHQPLTWTARTQIALDAAKGIEYIHDHTKARHVHRDIKSSNILLDQRLHAKVSDFGLAKLAERSSEEELIATRLVGTPGYLPPESVLELQVTSKTDVYAFGVVLAELITGKRALIRDNREPNKMRSLIAIVSKIFQDKDPETALEKVIDQNLTNCFPMDEVFKMAEIAEWCMSENAMNRPEMRDIVAPLSQIAKTSVEWEASLGGNSQVFSGLFNGGR